MVRTRNFGRMWKKLCEKVTASAYMTVADVTLMEYLELSPPSWKVWKPKLIEKSRIYLYIDYEDNIPTHFHISYDKRNKTWTAKIYDYKDI